MAMTHPRSRLMTPPALPPCSSLLAGLLASAMLISGCERRVSEEVRPASAPTATVASAPVPASAAHATAQAAQLAPYLGPIRIEGVVDGVSDGTPVELLLQVGIEGSTQKLAKTVVKNGRFLLEAVATQVAMGAVQIGEKDSVDLVIEKGEFKVVQTRTTLDVTGTGALTTQVFSELNQNPTYRKLLAEHAAAEERLFKGVNLENEKATVAARKKLDALPQDHVKMRAAHYARLVKDASLPPMVRLLALGQYDGAGDSQAQRDQLLADLEQALGPHPLIQAQRDFAKMAQENEALAQSVAPGKPFKDLMLRSAEGAPIRLSDVIKQHKLVLLDFWASWCSPCRGEFPHLKKVHAQYKSQGFEIYAVSLDESDAAWRQALKEENVPWLNVIDDKGLGSESARAYGITGVPANFLIDAQGTIVAVNAHEWEVVRAVKAAMAKVR